MKKYILPAFLVLSATLFTSFISRDGWFQFEDANYKVLFPQKPSDETDTVATALGTLKMNIHMYEVPPTVTDENFTYGVIQTDYPEGAIDVRKEELINKFFRGSIDGAVRNVNGKLLTESTISLDGYPGREVRVDYNNGVAVITMRMYLVKNTMYMLQTITGTAKDHNPSIGKFMNSFALKKKAS